MAATKPRLIIVGLDGATWDAALPYIEAGRLPTLARFMRDGAWGTLNSIHPPETGCCWPTIFTGTNPGKHGVFGFFSLRPGTYERTSTTLADWRMPPLWTLLNHAGMSAGVYNIPVTFPAEAIDGFMVSGEMGAPRVDDRLCASEPARNLIASELTDYEIEPVNGRNRRRDAKRLRRQIEIRNRAAMALARGIPTDALMVTVNYIDHAQHLFWDERLEGTANPVLMAYEGADRLLRSLMDLAGDECDVVVISDHGSGPVEGYLDFDRMLSDLGYLDFIGAQGGKARGGRVPQFLRPLAFRIFSRLPESLRGFARKAHGGRRVDYAATRLYSVGGFGSLRANVTGRDPDGCVPPDELSEFRHEVKTALEGIEGLDGGALAQVFQARELHAGPHVDIGPDMVAAPQGYALELARGTPGNVPWLVSREQAIGLGMPQRVRTGSHRMQGIVAAMGPHVRPGEVTAGANLVDVAPTALALLGWAVPDHMDGAPMPWAAPTGSSTFPAPDDIESLAPATQKAPSSEDEEAVLERLKRLGYLD